MESMKHTDYTDQTDQAEGTRIRKYHYNKKLVLRPKALGDIRGISYIYALFYRFELIEVPEKSRKKNESGAKRGYRIRGGRQHVYSSNL